MSKEVTNSKLKVIVIDGTVASGKTTLAQTLANRSKAPYFDTGRLVRLFADYLLLKGLKKGPGMKRFIFDNIKAIDVNEDIYFWRSCIGYSIETSLIPLQKLHSDVKRVELPYCHDANYLHLENITKWASIISTYKIVQEKVREVQNRVIKECKTIINEYAHDKGYTLEEKRTEYIKTCNRDGGYLFKCTSPDLVIVANNIISADGCDIYNIFLTANVHTRAARRFIELCARESINDSYLPNRDIRADNLYKRITNLPSLILEYKKIRSAIRKSDLRIRTVENIQRKISVTNAFVLDSTNNTPLECATTFMNKIYIPHNPLNIICNPEKNEHTKTCINLCRKDYNNLDTSNTVVADADYMDPNFIEGDIYD